MIIPNKVLLLLENQNKAHKIQAWCTWLFPRISFVFCQLTTSPEPSDLLPTIGILVLLWHIIVNPTLWRSNSSRKKHCRSPENSQQERNSPSPQNHLWALLVTKWEWMVPSHTSTAETLQLNSPAVAPYSCLAGSASNTHSKAENMSRVLLFFFFFFQKRIFSSCVHIVTFRFLWLIG